MVKKPVKSMRSYGLYVPDSPNDVVKNSAAKGEVMQKEIKFPKELGIEHPFDFAKMEGLMRKFGIASGVVHKYMDFIVGPGFYIKSKDKRAVQIIEDFMDSIQWDAIFREWLKEALSKGNGFLELAGKQNEAPQRVKLLDAKYMYVVRDQFGEVIGYNQYISDLSKFSANKIISFKPWEIAHLKINTIANDAYGLGILYPAEESINNYLGCVADMHTLIKRKANSPLHITLGDYSQEDVPTNEEIQDFGQKTEYMALKQEWTTGPNVKMEVVDFGMIGEKFSFTLENDLNEMFFTWQVPEVLMGKGNMPEGLATAQTEHWKSGRVQSMQAEIEKVIEDQIFQRVLIASKIAEHVEFEWGEPSSTEKDAKIAQITELLKLFDLNATLREELEMQVADLLGVDTEKLQNAEAQKKKEETQPQPPVPGQQRQMLEQGFENLEDTADYSLKEWLGFNYQEYKDAILSFIKKHKFTDLLATTQAERTAGLLSAAEIKMLKEVLSTGFNEEKSIRQIAAMMNENIKFRDRLLLQDGEVYKGEDGQPRVIVQAARRAIMISRTETTKAAAEGSLIHYADNDIEKVRFMAYLGARTCDICIEMNGRIFTVDEASGVIPQHVNCRCTFVPISPLSQKMRGKVNNKGEEKSLKKE